MPFSFFISDNFKPIDKAEEKRHIVFLKQQLQQQYPGAVITIEKDE